VANSGTPVHGWLAKGVERKRWSAAGFCMFHIFGGDSPRRSRGAPACGVRPRHAGGSGVSCAMRRETSLTTRQPHSGSPRRGRNPAPAERRRLHPGISSRGSAIPRPAAGPGRPPTSVQVNFRRDGRNSPAFGSPGPSCALSRTIQIGRRGGPRGQAIEIWLNRTLSPRRPPPPPETSSGIIAMGEEIQ
jgi:hypothetical protein